MIQMRYRVIIGVAVIFMGLVTVHRSEAMSVTNGEISSQLERLDKELVGRQVYIQARRHRIDSLRRLCNSREVSFNDRKWFSDVMTLADEYNSFDNDSALFYYRRGYEVASGLRLDSISTAFRLKRATFMPLAGLTREAVDEINAVDTSSMTTGLKELYYDSSRQMYSYLASFFKNYPETGEGYNRMSTDSQRRLLGVLEENSLKYRLNLGEFYYNTHEYSKARETLLELLGQLPEEDNMYARAAHIIADIAKARGDHNEYVYYLVLSAIADTKGATLEVSSLQELGQLMFSRDEIGRAHTYLSIALSNAVDCHAPLRMLQSAEGLPVIESAHAAEIEQSRSRIYTVIALMAVLLVALGATMLFLRRENRRSARMRVNLEIANHAKEVYISQFLNLCSIYMDKLHQFCKIVDRKISTGKIEDLHKMTKSGRFVEEQSREFHEVFDNAFLHIYPNFVEEVNALLRPDARISLNDGEHLNTDLRILAFMRLGIEESPRIAQVLNYSVYTIYTYRNKLRNRAINRETFEQDIMKIK